jgi:hypothetical protein
MRPFREKTASSLRIVSLSFSSYQDCFIAKFADPIIFRGLKALTMDNSQQQSLLRLAAEGISASRQYLQQVIY